MFVIIELKDHEDKSHDSVKFELQDQTTIKELQNKIHSSFRIELESQRIFDSNSRRIDLLVGSLEEAGIKCGETLILKHNMLINWQTYLQMIEEIRGMTTSGVTEGRREIALNARMQLSPLDTSKFFVTYPTLMIERLRIGRDMNFLIHNTKKYLDRSVLAYFEALYPNQKVELKDKFKECAGLGVFVFVQDIGSYYAKTLGTISEPEEEIDFPNRPIIDPIEIFVYILLRFIGLGSAEVHIIPDVNKPELVFISTKLIDNFRTASGVSVTQMLENAPPEARESVVIDTEMKRQMKILSSLLCLNDLQRNKGNHGVVERQSTEAEKREGKEGPIRELRIIDFGVNMGSIVNDPAIFNSIPDIPFLKTYFEKWDILNNIYKAKETMENDPALKNNKNVNRKAFDCYFKRLETALRNFFSNK